MTYHDDREGNEKRAGDVDQPPPSTDGGYVPHDGTLAHLEPKGYPLYCLPEGLQEWIKADQLKQRERTSSITIHAKSIPLSPHIVERSFDAVILTMILMVLRPIYARGWIKRGDK